jgi:hypothetical protein
MTNLIFDQRLPVVYESLPPAVSGAGNSVNAAAALARTLSGFGDIVDALLVPHVEDESGGGLKIDRYVKDDAIAFAARYLELAQAPAPRAAMVAQPLTHLPDAQIQSLLDRVASTGIGALAVVGPASRDQAGANPTSTSAAITRCAADPRIRCGAIAIHARTAEPARMLAKIRSGAEFFLSQIYYDADSMAATIASYGRSCRQAEIKPVRLFLSLVPVISPPTARLMAKVINPGQRLPEPAAAIPADAVGPSAVDFLKDLLAATLEAGAAAGVPLGVSIGHVTERNVRLSLELLAAVGQFK